MSNEHVWFKTDNPKAVMIIAHGLNLMPSRMDELADFFSQNQFDVLRISLGSDPSHWEEIFSLQYEEAKNKNIPMYFLGYSIGALVGLHSQKPFEKMALIAPATHTKFYTKLLSLLIRINPKGALPSLNLENYRARSFTTLAEYKKMIDMQLSAQRELKKLSSPLLILSKKDELVKTRKLIKLSEKNQWPYLLVSNKNSPLPRKYHHLMITSESLGQPEWAKMLNKLSAHFS